MLNPTSKKGAEAPFSLATLTITAVQAGHAPIHQDAGFGVTFFAKLRTLGEAFIIHFFTRFGVFFEVFSFFVFYQFLLVFIQARFFEHADFLQVLLNHFTDFCH